MADIKGDLEVGKDLRVAVKATINSNDDSQTLVVGGTAKFTDVIVSSTQGSYSLPLSAGVSGQLLISTGNGGRFNWRDRDETLYLTETSANGKFLQIANVTGGGIISSEISGLSVKLSAADRTPTFSTTNFGGGQQISIGVSANRDFSFRTVEGAGSVQVRTSSNSIIVSAPIYNQVSALSQLTNDQEFVSATQFAGAGIIQVRTSGSQIIVSAASTQVAVQASALGGGSSVVIGTSANETRFRTIIGAGAIQVSAGATTITISAGINPTQLSQLTNNVGFVSAAQFVGAGIIDVRVSGVSNGRQIVVSAADKTPTFTTTNLGAGEQISTGVSGNRDFTFRSITGAGAIQVSAGATEITVCAAPNPTALSQLTNDQGFVSALQFTGAGIIDVRTSGSQIIVSAATTQVAVQASALGGGSSVIIGTSANETRFRTFVGSGIIDVRTSGNVIEVSAADRTPTFTTTNVGGGQQVSIGVSSNRDFTFRSVEGAGSVQVRTSSNSIVVSAPIYNQVSALSQLINNQGFVSAAQVAGAGIINVRVSGAGAGLQIIVSAASTQVAVQASALGGGSSVIIGTSANETRFRTFVGSGNIQVSAGATTITISGPANPTALSQLTNDVGFTSAAQFVGAGIIDVRVSGTSNGRQIFVSAADRTPTFTTTNLGGGQQLALTVSANRDLRFRTINGGGTIDVRTSGNVIKVSASDNGKFKAAVTQTAHGFANNQVIYLDSQDSLWKLAIANDAAKMGVAVVTNATTNTFDALFGGTVITSGLLPGNYYFTSDITPGLLTVSAPSNTNSFINPVLYAVSNTTAVILPWRPNSNNENILSDSLTKGFRTIWQPAGSMLAKITDGAQYITREVGSSQVLTPLYVFSNSVNQSVQFSIAMPKSWNESTVNYQILWSKNAGAAGDVVWGVRAMALSNGDAINGTWGTQVLITDDATATNNQVLITDISNDLTIGNNPVENDLVIFEITRISNNVNDTFTGDAELIGIKILINIDQENDNF